VKSRLIFYAIIFILSVRGYPQNLSQTIRGTVSDKETKIPLPGANIILLNSDPIKGATTDIQGKFRLENIAVGRQSLKISFLGYDDIILKNIEVSSAHELVLNIELNEKVYTSREVVISGKNEKQNNINEMSVISTRQFTVEESNQYAGAWGDISRMASNFAGVSVASDERNDIVVRGNSPMGILWRIDGVEMPNPNHFADVGSSGGGISMINNNLLDNSDFLSGAFAPEYGNATSAVFDLKMRNGNNEKREYLAQIGARGVQAGVEGPFVKGKQASYLAYYNYSTVALLSLMGIKIIDAVPNFQDLSFKFHFPLKKGYISLLGVGGISKSVYKPPKDSSLWANDGDRLGDISGSQSAIGAFTWFYPLGKNSYLKTIVSSSYFSPDYTEDSTGNDYQIYQLSRKSSEQQNNIASILFHSKINVRHIIRSGIIFRNQNFADNTFSYTYNGGEHKHILNDNKGSLNLVQAYFQYKYTINENFSVTPGFHTLYLLNNGRLSFEPRVAFRYTINGNHALTLGFGVHGQTQPSQIYYAEVLSGTTITHPNVSLNFTKSYQAVLSYDWLLSEFWRSKIEVYYQYLTQIPVAVDFPVLSLVNFSNADNAFANKTLTNKGKGRNYGMELTIEKFLSKGYYILLTASAYDSKYFDADGKERNTRYNSNYTFNLLGGKEFKIGKKKNSIIGISVKVVEIGGQRYTPLDLEQSIAAHQAVYIDSLAFTKKTKDFFKLDFRIRYRLNAKKCSHEFAFELGNVFNRKNIAGFRYNPYTNEIDNIYDLPLIPLASYRIEF